MTWLNGRPTETGPPLPGEGAAADGGGPASMAPTRAPATRRPVPGLNVNLPDFIRDAGEAAERVDPRRARPDGQRSRADTPGPVDGVRDQTAGRRLVEPRRHRGVALAVCSFRGEVPCGEVCGCCGRRSCW